MERYDKIIRDIIKNAIRSAIFIDENALEPYQKPSDPEIKEERLSVDLYNEFYNNSIALTNYKYRKDLYSASKDYLLHGKDLILLDWKLNGDSGEEDALNVLEDTIKYHIPFCVVYTKETTDSVFENLLSFFMGFTERNCEDIRLSLLLDMNDENDKVFFSQISDMVHSGNFPEQKIKAMRECIQFREIFANEYFKDESKDIRTKFEGCWCAYMNLHKSRESTPKFLSFDSEEKLIVVNDTFITILNKEATNASLLREKFLEIISGYKNSFSKLLRLEINWLIREKGISINSEVSSIAKDTYRYHKKQNKEEFENFIKNIVLNGVALNLLDAPLSLIQSLDIKSDVPEPPVEELIKMNTFYNATYRNGAKRITFGDVFQLYENAKEKDEYYICITPLCDCVHPKNEMTFYFAKGTKVPKDSVNKELKNAEEAFTSYIPFDILVKWNEVHSGKPTYITPIPLTVPKLVIKNDTINAYQLQAKVSRKKKLQLHYITTLKQNYAQRIANHAFTHSTRVGITYVSKAK